MTKPTVTKFEVTEQMVEAAIAAKALYWFEPPQNISEGDDMRAAITAAFEASGLVERIAELEAGERQMFEQWNRLQDLLQSYEDKCQEHGIQLIEWKEFKPEELAHDPLSKEPQSLAEAMQQVCAVAQQAQQEDGFDAYFSQIENIALNALNKEPTP